jgi:hypothetical protein
MLNDNLRSRFHLAPGKTISLPAPGTTARRKKEEQNRKKEIGKEKTK